METYLMITQINDFIFCPRSLYFHDIYRNTTADDVCYQTPQLVGRAAHETLDQGTYSTRKDILTGTMVYSQQYRLLGRIDMLDLRSGLLVERKYSITAVYDGFRYQLYAQYFALKEMGYGLRAMRLHSLKDNRNYEVPLPLPEDIRAFETILDDINTYRLDIPFSPNLKKCMRCIYASLCDMCPIQEEFAHDVVS